MRTDSIGSLVAGVAVIYLTTPRGLVALPTPNSKRRSATPLARATAAVLPTLQVSSPVAEFNAMSSLKFCVAFV
ncbi:hypothetical protein D3C78_918460 [compost metagenome]